MTKTKQKQKKTKKQKSKEPQNSFIQRDFKHIFSYGSIEPSSLYLEFHMYILYYALYLPSLRHLLKTGAACAFLAVSLMAAFYYKRQRRYYEYHKGLFNGQQSCTLNKRLFVPTSSSKNPRMHPFHL